MCGIFGSVSPPIGTLRHKKWIDQSLNLLNERGPDSQGHLVFKNVTMGATRLRVHDTREIADQPMTSSCGLFSIIFNGAIYNYRDLRRELSANGVHFDTESDTEVLLKSFISWGVSCFVKLRGMFSFALLDKANSKLYICRDQLGIKPLYYSLSKKHIVFSSLIKPILAFSNKQPDVEKTKIPEQFAFQCLAPPSTIFSGISALRPGYYITVDFLNGFSAKQFCYWKIDDSLISPRICDDVEKLLIKTNVIGTANLVKLSIEHDIKKFVLVSTDKAVKPINVMGATKRLAELICQGANNSYSTRFMSVRFGNVLGSSGSVIPIFQEQIKAGGPITITDPEMERYFMSITEAAQLIIQAGSLGKGGEVYALDMGQPIKIIDIANELIRLSGLEPDIDIPISFIGARPGEKQYEELSHDAEIVQKTLHDKIFDDFLSRLNSLFELIYPIWHS